jgi:hypothetical protein
MTVRKTNNDNLFYIKHECNILNKIKKGEWYHGEHIYIMQGSTQWYFMMVSDYAESFDTPINFCPYCGDKL